VPARGDDPDAPEKGAHRVRRRAGAN